MKKSYTKPDIYLESFRMSDSIAGPCLIDVGFSDVKPVATCRVHLYDERYLFLNETVCTLPWSEFGESGCYDIPTGGHGYFGS